MAKHNIETCRICEYPQTDQTAYYPQRDAEKCAHLCPTVVDSDILVHVLSSYLTCDVMLDVFCTTRSTQVRVVRHLFMWINRKHKIANTLYTLQIAFHGVAMLSSC